MQKNRNYKFYIQRRNERLNLKKKEDLLKLIKVTFYPGKSYFSHEYVSYTTDLPFN